MEAMESDVTPPKRLRLMEDEYENYDVFLSHRGPDTKTGFVGFLFEGLKAVGLRPFLDCKSIDKGQDTWKCIEDAVKKTPIALVIFSESFAQSEWCLRELHVMLDTPCIRVLPIFYKVQPRELRHPESGQLRDGFKNLEKRHDKTVIEQWKADLKNASELMGWEHSDADKRLEKDLVTEIVGKIFELANKPLPLDVGEYVVGVKQVAEDIIQMLDNKKRVLMLGLWGMGGIGKSTIARELYNQLGKRFAASCYVEDVREKVIQGGVVKVQNCILKDLCTGKSKKIKDRFKGKTILEERLCRKQILLVLDDVCDCEEMKYMITHKMLIEGSMCIVTSRDKRIFEASNSFDHNHEIYIHDVQLLSSEDSKQVFVSYAFGGNCKVRPGFEKLVANISMACGGVPLVLKVCGALLTEEENVDIWEEVMLQLNCGVIMNQEEIFKCLRISYDALSQEHQEMFLDIACALLGRSEDMAKRVWKSMGWFPTLGVRSLVKKALVTVDGEGCFTMHDHLRDMGREIVRKRRESEGVYRRLWMPESLKFLKFNKSLPNSLQTLIVFNNHDYMYRDGPLIDDLDLSHMKELRILMCDNSINLTSIPENLRWFSWQEQEDKEDRLIYPVGNIFSIAPKNNMLVVLDIDYTFHNFESVNEKIYFRSLQVLHYRDCEVHPEMSFGEEILQSKDLEFLDLSYCCNLFKLPEELGSLRNLSSLCLDYCNLKALPNSLGELLKLKKLSMYGCRELFVDDFSDNSASTTTISEIQNLSDSHLGDSDTQSLTKSFRVFSNFEVLNKSHSHMVNMLPDSFGGLKSLQDLNLGDSGIPSLPESFGELSNLEVLNMSKCKLNKLPNSFGGLKSLRDLNLKGSSIQSLPESFGELSNLEVLNMRNSKLNMLPNSFGGLKSLRDLNLEYCGIQSLPHSFGELSNLEVLKMRTSKLNMLPDSFGGLKSLRDLNLEYCGIQSLPQSFGELSNLEVLNMRNSKLNMLPNSFGGLKSLRDLNLEYCGIQSLPHSFGELSNLEVLKMRTSKLNMLPNSFGGLKSLRDLNLKGSSIQSLPESFGELSNLEVLNMRNSKLNMLPNSFGGLKSLRDLNLEYCGIQSLPHSFGELSNLEVLKMRTSKLNMLPDSFGGLKSLRDLNLEYCGIQSLPQSFGELSNLEVLNMRNSKLNMLPDSCGGLKSLRDLNLACCGIQSLPEFFGELSNLEVLNMRNPKLNMLPDSFGGLKSLRDLNLAYCGIQSLPESFGELSNLEVLSMRGCELNMLPDSFGGLKSLRDLNLEYCGIQSLPQSFGELSNLEVLSMKGFELNMLPDSFGGLKSLRDLNLEYCGIQSLPQSFGELSNLEVLSMKGFELNMLPDSFGGLKSLRDLNLACCGIQSLPQSFGELSNLEVLNMSECELKTLPDSFGGLKSLRDLNLAGCGIQSLPESFGELSNLEVLSMGDSELSMLPDSFGGLKSLRDLNLAISYSLNTLPDSFGGLKSLQDLNLAWCDIQSLPESFGELSNLEVLNMSECKLKTLPDSFGGLKSLWDLNLAGSGIQSLPESFGELSNLEVLSMRDSELNMLLDSFGGL